MSYPYVILSGRASRDYTCGLKVGILFPPVRTCLTYLAISKTCAHTTSNYDTLTGTDYMFLRRPILGLFFLFSTVVKFSGHPETTILSFTSIHTYVIDRSLNEAVTDKIRKYHSDYNNNPPSAVSFMFPIPNTSGRLHSEFIRLLFLQTHRETDRFFSSIKQWTFPLPPCGVLFSDKSNSRQHHRQDCHFTLKPFLNHHSSGVHVWVTNLVDNPLSIIPCLSQSHL
jgi:hypothetical protein